MAVVEQKEEIIREHRTHEGDTGSPEVQVAVLTRRIAHLTEHFANTSTTTIRGGDC